MQLQDGLIQNVLFAMRSLDKQILAARPNSPLFMLFRLAAEVKRFFEVRPYLWLHTSKDKL